MIQSMTLVLIIFVHLASVGQGDLCSRRDHRVPLTNDLPSWYGGKKIDLSSNRRALDMLTAFFFALHPQAACYLASNIKRLPNRKITSGSPREQKDPARISAVIMGASDLPSANQTQVSKKKMFSFEEARLMAQWMGFESKDEWDTYEPEGGGGVYRLPKDPDVVYAGEFVDWGDWLGLIFPFEEARQKVRSLSFNSKDQYEAYVLEPQRHTPSKDRAFSSLVEAMGGKRTGTMPSTRLPWKPDLYYKHQWQGWEDWLGSSDGLNE